MQPATERLQKILAEAGVASRRKARDYIKSGRITVNQVLIREPGFRCDPLRDKILFDGRPVKKKKNIYILLNKPRGILSTVRDPFGKPTVIDLVRSSHLFREAERIFPVGRLDKDTRGLILLTNDGELAFRITHPKFEVKKTYEALVEGVVKDKDIKRLRQGIALDGKPTAPCRIKILKQSPRRTRLLIEIHEGRKRQIRRMFEVRGYKVIELKRTRLANLKLGSLREGDYRELSGRELEQLKRIS